MLVRFTMSHDINVSQGERLRPGNRILVFITRSLTESESYSKDTLKKKKNSDVEYKGPPEGEFMISPDWDESKVQLYFRVL